MFIVMDIGCLHCGEPSGVVGKFHSEEEAHAIAKMLMTKEDSPIQNTKSGGRYVEVFEIPEEFGMQQQWKEFYDEQ